VRAVAGVVVCVAAAWPSAAVAQQINGLAAWTVGQSTNVQDDQRDQNTSLSQHYVVGLDSPFVDARLMRFNTEVSFRTNALTARRTDVSLQGDQRNVGYKAGAALFPQRSFPLTVQASRDIVDESGEYPSSSAIRGGVVVPADQVAPAFQTINRSLNANWQLSAAHLPRIDLGYVSGRTETAGSIYRAAQRHEDVHAGATKETSRTRHVLRYDRNAIDNLILNAYNQRTSDLDYEFGALLGARSRFNVHSGRRRTFSLFDLPTQIVDPATGAFALPPSGDMSTQYLITSASFEPDARVSFDATGSIDRQSTAPVAIGARLLVGTARLDVGGGLSLNASGTYGTREQIMADHAVGVVTRGTQAGAAFRTGPRWLEASLNAARGVGSNRTPQGASGDTQMWAGQATLTSSIRWFAVSAGEERSQSRDQILDFGNSDVIRDRASVQVQPGRFALLGSWEDAEIARGRDLTFSRTRQQTTTGAGSFRLGRSATLTATGGRFTSAGLWGSDTTRFWGGAFDAAPVSALHVTAWIRRDAITATQTELEQQSFAWFGSAEYRLRDFTVALEYRNTDQNLHSGLLADRYSFSGRQILFRIARKVNIPL